MRVVRIVVAAAILAFPGTSFAQVAEAPCGAVKTPTLVPCDAPAPADVLATSGGAPLKAADLSEALRARAARVEEDVAKARRDALNDEIDDVLLRLEAERRNVPLRDLVAAEVVAKAPAPGEEEMRALYATWAARGRKGTFEELAPSLRSQILAERRAARFSQLASSLRTAFPVKPGADAGSPNLAKDVVLATVGGRPVTVSSAGSRLDAAAFRVRWALFRDQRGALEKAAAARRPKDPNAAPDAPEPEFKLVGLRPPVAPYVPLDLGGVPSRGPDTASVTVVEFGDFECPPCRRLWPVLDEALAPYGDKVRYVFRNYTMAFHPRALDAAAAAKAAQAQGKFFPYAEILVKDVPDLADETLRSVAERAGLDVERFDRDRATYLPDLVLEHRAGARAGVRATPAVFVNGVFLDNAQLDVAGVRAAVDAALLDPVLGTLDGAPIMLSELDPELRRRVAGIDEAVAAARRRALDAEIADARLRLEADRRRLSFRDFWETEVLRKTPPPTEAEIAAALEDAKAESEGRSLEDLRPVLESAVLAKHRAKREADLAASLEGRYPRTAGGDPASSSLAPIEILATVGPRTITAAQVATRLDAAGFAERRDLHYEIVEAVEERARVRVAEAEAAKRGVSVADLAKEKGLGKGHSLALLARRPAAPALAIVVSGAAARGPADAPVTVVEFADFECPHCAKAWEAAEEALTPFGAKVRWVYLSLPLPFHPHALLAAQAARAALAQGRFFEMAALLFRNQKDLAADGLKRRAAAAGLDAARFAADLDSGRFAPDVLLEAREAERLAVPGTPTFFVNGAFLPWESMDAKGIRAAVEAALPKAAKAP